MGNFFYKLFISRLRTPVGVWVLITDNPCIIDHWLDDVDDELETSFVPENYRLSKLSGLSGFGNEKWKEV